MLNTEPELVELEAAGMTCKNCHYYDLCGDEVKPLCIGFKYMEVNDDRPINGRTST